MADLTNIKKSCECQQFENCDPRQKPPTDQETRKHYIIYNMELFKPAYKAFRKQKAGHFELNGMGNILGSNTVSRKMLPFVFIAVYSQNQRREAKAQHRSFCLDSMTGTKR